MNQIFIDPLESRLLLAGVTLITHGRTGHLWGNVQTAANSITKRLGGPAQAPQYILKLTPESGGRDLIPTLTHVNGTGTPQTSTSGEIIILVDWTSVDADIGYSLPYVASVVTDFFKNSTVDGVRLAELPLHSLSISRGTGLIDEISRSLGHSGIWVDQETYWDPNPVEVMGDATPTVYDNVAFVDNYWRWDGHVNNSSTNGMPVDGAYNLNVQWLDDDASGWPLKHLVPAGYYIGTIEPTTTTTGEGPIRDTWYGNGHPERDETGFIYTSIVGAARPISGVWAASGGTGSRTDTGEDGEQWSNVADLTVSGGTSFASGKSLSLSFIQQDRDSSSTITFYLDTDQNPYNNSFSRTLGSVNLAASSTISSGQTAGSTTGVAAGTYWIVAKSSDQDGHSRFDYGRQITITPAIQNLPPPVNAILSADHTLRVVGTSADDVIRISQSPSVANRLKVNLNGTVVTFILSNVQRIYAYGLNGNDRISIDERYGAIFVSTRLMGGAGNDALNGGSAGDIIAGDDGNDWLYGFGGNDRLNGGAGVDHLIGGNGTDQLYGEAGNDLFHSAKTIELKDFIAGDILTL